MTPLDLFLTTAADLYETNPEYRAELDTELTGPTDPPDRPMSTWERLTELEWLIRNGMPAWFAVEQVGWSVEAAGVAAKRWCHPVHGRLLPVLELSPSGYWAAEWAAGRAA
jgi:hypothetical protein